MNGWEQLNLVFKTGRKASRSSIHIFNVRIDDLVLLPDSLHSIAWSFRHDRPIKEIIPCYTYIRMIQKKCTHKE